MQYTEAELEARLDVLYEHWEMTNKMARDPKHCNPSAMEAFEVKHEIEPDDWFSDLGSVERVLYEYYGE